mgnify:FL=1
MISRTSMKSQMKGNKMPIKVVPLNQNNKDDQKMRVLKKKPATKKELRAKSGGSIKKMKKGGVIKAGMGSMLETISPAYSIMKGKGPMSSIASALGGSSLIGNFAQRQKDKSKKRRMEMAAGREGSKRMTPATPANSAAVGMKGGGSVKKKRSIDGIATKGKTRG